MPRTMLLAAAIVVALLPLCSAAKAGSDGWFRGRGTFYTDNQQGSCHYGAPANAFYGAWPDTQDGFPACGQCWEVRCVSADFKDGFGQDVQRSSACYDERKAVVVKIIDSCPCVHANYYSNQRWCCGDAPHIDVSKEVFSMLAPEGLGVVGMKWRRASCNKLGPISTTTNSQPDSAQPQDGGTPTAAAAPSSSQGKGAPQQSERAAPSPADSLDAFVAAANLDNPKIEGDHLVMTQQEWDALVASSAGDTWTKQQWQKPKWLTLSGRWRR